MELTCHDCHLAVSPDEAFIRSVNLTTTAWCRDCWRAKHADLFVPQQRSTPEKKRRRWLLIRSSDGAQD